MVISVVIGTSVEVIAEVTFIRIEAVITVVAMVDTVELF